MIGYLIASIVINVIFSITLISYIAIRNSKVKTVIGYYLTCLDLYQANNEVMNKLHSRKDIKIVSIRAICSIDNRLIIKYIPLDEDAVVEIPLIED